MQGNMCVSHGEQCHCKQITEVWLGNFYVKNMINTSYGIV